MFFLTWVLFATLYVAYGEWNRFRFNVYEAAYNRGKTETVQQVILEAQKCQPFPVVAGEAKTTLISLECAAVAPAKGAKK